MDIFLQKKILIRVIILLTILNVVSIGAFLCKSFLGNSPTYTTDSHTRIDMSKQQPDTNENFATKDAPKEKEIRELGDILERELHLSKTQVVQITELRSKYYKKDKELFKKMKGKKQQLTREIFNKNTDEKLVISLIKDVSVIEYEKEMMRFEQIKELKTLCTPEQLDKFEDLMREMKEYFKPPKPLSIREK